jgi:hypothetical protein
MKNWKELDIITQKKAWEFVSQHLHFKKNANGIIELPTANFKFDIRQFYNENFKEELYNDLHNKVKKWFEVFGTVLYSLEWKGECYSFNPHLPFEMDEFGEWLIPAFPNGDFSFFLTPDFKNGIFVDGINLTFSIWGEGMIHEYKKNTPKMLNCS